MKILLSWTPRLRWRLARVDLGYQPRDAWVGVYVETSRRFTGGLDIYICLVPILPIRLTFERTP